MTQVFPTLQRGSEGADVERLQHWLVHMGYPLAADGDFGPKTETQLRAFQREYGLGVDAVAGPVTWATLRDAVSARPGADPESHGWEASAADEADDEPRRPDFGPIVGNVGRQQVFGKFRYAPLSTPGNPEGIRFLDDWPERNIITVVVPQLARIAGVAHGGQMVGAGPKSGHVQCHRLVADQLKALWQAWDDAGLLDRVLTWAGLWNPRFIRGSRSVLSNHSFGSAFDINAPYNGLGRTPAPRGQRGSVIELVDVATEHGWYWGGFFSRKDGMHWEVAVIKG